MSKPVQEGEVVEKTPLNSQKSKTGSGAGASAGSSTTAASVKKLVRPKQGRALAGVCAAFANYFAIDVIIVRLLVIGVAILAGGFPMLAAYVVAWLVIPEEK